MRFRVNGAEWPVTAERFVPQAGWTNFFRGLLGAQLKHSDDYGRLFDPQWSHGPSGLLDAPRPFVLRWHLECLQLTCFGGEGDAERLTSAMEKAILGRSELTLGSRRSLGVLELCLDEVSKAVNRLRVEFVTPTELKSGSRVASAPEFATLMKRLRDRVWALGHLYQGWGPETTLQLPPGSDSVVTTCGEWSRQEQYRVSARSGVRHSLGGFTGWAEYQGLIGPSLPLLRVGEWTGVGRQTAWGKGEITISIPD